MSFGLVSGFSLPLIYAIGVVFKAIFTKRFSDDLLFTKDFRSSFYEFLHPAMSGIFSVSTCLQIQISLSIQYFIRFCIIGEEKKFYMMDMLNEGLKIHFNTVFFYFLVTAALKWLTWTWNKIKANVFSSINKDCKDEFDNCWRLQTKNDFSVAELLEFLHILVGLASALLFIYYCGDASRLYMDIYKWIDFSTYYP